MIRVDKPNKSQIGYSKQEDRIKTKLGKSVEVRSHVRTLWVRGTLDILARSRFDRTWISKEHPIDKGYYKKVLVLNDTGRSELNRLRDNKIDKLV